MSFPSNQIAVINGDIASSVIAALRKTSGRAEDQVFAVRREVGSDMAVGACRGGRGRHALAGYHTLDEPTVGQAYRDTRIATFKAGRATVRTAERKSSKVAIRARGDRGKRGNG